MSGSWGFFFLVAGLVIITFSIGRIIRARLAGRQKASAEWRDSVHDGLDAHEDKNVADRLKYEEELGRHLDNRINTLKALIKEADERIEKLSHSAGGDKEQAVTEHNPSLPKAPEDGAH